MFARYEIGLSNTPEATHRDTPPSPCVAFYLIKRRVFVDVV